MKRDFPLVIRYSGSDTFYIVRSLDELYDRSFHIVEYNFKIEDHICGPETTVGEAVIFTGRAMGLEAAKASGMEMGKVYYVRTVTIGGSYTMLTLNAGPYGQYNSCDFCRLSSPIKLPSKRKR